MDSGVSSLDTPWHDRSDAQKLAARIAGLPPVMQRADQELERLRQALIQAWAEIAELRILADHDALTGLASRRRVLSELEDIVEQCRRHGGDASLVFMDVDRLKTLNDNFGHQTGDAAIVHIARIIRESLRGGFAGRFGGDEFIILFKDMNEQQARAQAAMIARRIAGSPLSHEGVDHLLSVSFGVTAVCPTLPVQALLARADAAMYELKRAG